MRKIFLLLLISLSSLFAFPVMAKNCSTGLGIVWRIGSEGQNHLMAGTYTSADNGPAGQIYAAINGNMDCQGDYTDPVSAQQVSQMVLTLSNGNYCKNSDTISIGNTGLEWKLENMTCQNGTITSNTVKKFPLTDWTVQWPDNTQLGTATLFINDEYWKRYTDDDARDVMYSVPSFGMGSLSNSPTTNVGSDIGNSRVMTIYNQGTCTMGLSSENLDFGRLSPNDINNGGAFKDVTMSYSCYNKATVNGLNILVEPEHVIDASQGKFSAKDNNGRDLIFQLSKQQMNPVVEQANSVVVPLNTSWPVSSPSNSDQYGQIALRITAMPSAPFPSGLVSTYLNIHLKYR